MKKVAVMVSWWLDSYIMYYYAKKNGYQPIPIRVDLWQPYREKELEAIKQFDFYKDIIQISVSDFVSKIPTNVDKQNQIIPWRNLLLWILWANFGEEVWIGALHSEWHWKERDKSFKFFEDTTNLLTYIFNIVRERTEIKTPFFHLTKTGVVKRAINNGISIDDLKKTSTCYDNEYHNCWECSTCFKRRMAMVNNGLEEEYQNNPRESNYAKEMIAEIKSGNKNWRLTEERIWEIKNALATKWIKTNEDIS